ncbi:RnfH family protein [Tahibacter caeni]|uniref:RnfH family protein n=1 Tax=Tahibacter caeni TaxID=1453545 RepID=UPI002148B4B4|nr:RnfH family protein [Tahibacter caeni]
MAETLRVEVAYVSEGQSFLQALELPAGACVADALAASALRRHFPELDPAASRVGIFSRPATPDTPLRDGDRVEVYRPLLVNPKEARRRRAQQTGKS